MSYTVFIICCLQSVTLGRLADYGRLQFILAVSSTKNKAQNSCHGIQLHSQFGSIVPSIILHTNIIMPWSVPTPNFSRTKTDYGKRSFAVNGSVVWNSLYLLTAELRSPDISLDVFKARLENFCLTADLVHAFGVFYTNFALYKCP